MNAAGASAPTSDLVVTVGCTAVPAAPATFTTAVTGTWSRCIWNVEPGTMQHGRSRSASRRARPSLTFPFAAPAAGDRGERAAGTYYVRVRAVNSCGQSAPSVERTVSCR